ncbi:MAG: zinc-ribbon domain-containing protein [Chloroflexi bacterium]|nr:zinc-ribbon domain-containing protein [Chloroflexota bacterium]
MYCSKCGAQIPDDSTFCSSCGAPVSGQAVKSQEARTLDVLSKRIQADPSGTLIVAGSLLAILGTFLAWITGRFSTIGVELSQGAVICTVAVLSLGVLILARSGAAGRWSMVMLLLSALALALIFQSIYFLNHNDLSIGAGVWVAMSGVLITAGGSLLEQCCPHKK